MKFDKAKKEMEDSIQRSHTKAIVHDAKKKDAKLLKGRKAKDDAAKEQEDRNSKFNLNKWKKANK